MPHYDYDKDYPFAAFITNLGKYNEGALVGEWVKFPTTAEELKKVFERIGIGAKDDFGQTYEEWFITDYDCYVDGLYDLLGEYANLDELNYLASKLDDMSQDEYERFQAAMEIGDHTGSIQELINLTENLDCYDIYPDIHDHDDLGRYYIEGLDAMQDGARAVLNAGGCATAAGQQALANLDRQMLALNASPGGAADLLAATLFLDRIETPNSKH